MGKYRLEAETRKEANIEKRNIIVADAQEGLAFIRGPEVDYGRD